MGVQPSGGRRQQSGNHKERQLAAKGVDTETSNQDPTAAQRANGSSFPRLQQVYRRKHRTEHSAPDQVVDLVHALELEAEETDGRDVS